MSSVCGTFRLLVDGAPAEYKAGNQGAKKKQTKNYVEISNQFYGGKGVTVFMESAAKAKSEISHVASWDANVQHMPC